MAKKIKIHFEQFKMLLSIRVKRNEAFKVKPKKPTNKEKKYIYQLSYSSLRNMGFMTNLKQSWRTARWI